MPEVRVSHLIIVLIIVALIGTPVLICLGALAIPSFDLFGWKTPELTKEKMDKAAEDALATTAGFTAAKTPTEAMDKFREAIQKRQYKFAARYVTKSYKEMLERAHPKASELANTLDKIHEYGKNKVYMTDKLTYAFYQLDPFPRNFKAGKPPVQKGDDKAYASYVWDVIAFKNPLVVNDPEWNSMDKKMFQTVLARQARFGTGVTIELVKEKESEEWKLNIPTDPDWEAAVSHFLERAPTYHANLDRFKGDMLNERFDSHKFETEILQQLRAAK